MILSQDSHATISQTREENLLLQQVIELFLVFNTVFQFTEYQSTGLQFSYTVTIMLLGETNIYMCRKSEMADIGPPYCS